MFSQNPAGLNSHLLIERLKYPLLKRDVVQLAKTYADLGCDLEKLLSLTLNSSHAISFHSAWVFENICTLNPNILDSSLPIIIEYLRKVKNTSVKRHFSKLVSIGLKRLLNKKNDELFQIEQWKVYAVQLEEVCFNWLLDEDCRPAIKSNSLEILSLLSKYQTWIASALPPIIQNLMEMSTPALRIKCKKVLMMLK